MHIKPYVVFTWKAFASGVLLSWNSYFINVYMFVEKHELLSIDIGLPLSIVGFIIGWLMFISAYSTEKRFLAFMKDYIEKQGD